MLVGPSLAILIAGAVPAASRPKVDVAMRVPGVPVALTLNRGRVVGRIEADDLGQPFLIGFRIVRGGGVSPFVTGQGFDPSASLWSQPAILARFQVRGDRLVLVREQVGLGAADRTDPVAAASFADQVLATFPILTEEPGTVSADVSDLVRQDLGGLRRLAETYGASSAAHPILVDPSRTTVDSLKVFAASIGVVATVTLAPAGGAGSPGVTVRVQTTLLPCPEPMAPRDADERVGFNVATVRDGSARGGAFTRSLIRRWRLEPGRPAGSGRYHPRQPITLTIDRTVPEPLRPLIRQGVLAWRTGFEAAGFMDAIRVEDLPPDGDPDDPGRSMIRWVSAADRYQFRGTGMALYDPRTGEQLTATVLLEADQMELQRRRWAPLLAGRAIPVGASGYPVHLEEELRWMVMHEVGHALGLEHNFRGSSSTPPARLNDPVWAATEGLASSVMDYLPLNVSPDPTRQGPWFPPAIGRGDVRAIRFGYAFDSSVVATAAAAIEQPGGGYLPQNDIARFDPRGGAWDLSDDPFGWARERFAFAATRLAELPRLARVAGPERALAVGALVSDAGGAVAVATRSVGGVWVSLARPGDPGAGAPFRPVPVETQRSALRWILEEAVRAPVWSTLMDSLLPLGQNPPDWTPGLDAIQEGLPSVRRIVERHRLEWLADLLEGRRLRWIDQALDRFGDAAMIGHRELFDATVAAVWDPVPLSAAVQGAVVARLAAIATGSDSSVSVRVASAAKASLAELQARLARSRPGETETEAAVRRALLARLPAAP